MLFTMVRSGSFIPTDTGSGQVGNDVFAIHVCILVAFTAGLWALSCLSLFAVCRTMEAARHTVVIAWDFNLQHCTFVITFIKTVVCIWVGCGLRRIDMREPIPKDSDFHLDK